MDNTNDSRTSITVLAILLFVLAALTHAVAAQRAVAINESGSSILSGIELEWLPATAVSELGTIDLTELAGVEIQIRDFADLRNEKNVLGENREFLAGGVLRQVTTSDNVAGWTKAHFEGLLEQFGFSVVPSTDQADVILEAEIRRLMVVENSGFEGEVGLFIRARSRTGETLFEGMAGGFSKRFARSYRASSYLETLSEALVDAVSGLVRSQGFRTGLSSVT